VVITYVLIEKDGSNVRNTLVSNFGIGQQVTTIATVPQIIPLITADATKTILLKSLIVSCMTATATGNIIVQPVLYRVISGVATVTGYTSLKEVIAYGQCVSYRMPIYIQSLALSGSDIENLGLYVTSAAGTSVTTYVSYVVSDI